MSEQKLITKEAVRRLLRDYWEQVASTPLHSLIAFITPGLGSILVFYVPPLIVAKLVDSFVQNKQISLESSLGYIGLFAGGWLLGEALWRFGIHFLIKVDLRGINVLAKKSFSALMQRDCEFYSNNFVGTLTKKASYYSKNFESLVDTFAFDIISEVIPMFFVLIVLWTFSPWIPITLIVFLTILILIAIPLIKKRVRLVAKRNDAGSKLTGRLSDSLTNIFAIKSFGNEKYEEKIFASHVDTYTKIKKQTHDYQNLRYDTVVSPIYVMTNTVGLVAAIYFAQTMSLSAGMVIVVFSYYAQITKVFWYINKIYRNVESAVSEAAEFTQILIDKPKIDDEQNAKDLKVQEGIIQFKNVVFDYSEDEENKNSFLENFNLEIQKNQKVGLVGPSGGGKTTITKMILRFIDPKFGEILIDGQNIKKVKQVSLRKNISYVPQEPLLFHRSLFENIAYGDEKATKEEVIKVAKIAHAHDFIKELPKGYDTLVGERGIKLSGGQRQRIAIARALLKKAPILVLDEATSALDSESEKYIQEGLKELMKNKTALVIAHRLSTIKHLDRIIVLDKGKIIQDGTHDELLKEEGLYRTLWMHQAGEFRKMQKII